MLFNSPMSEDKANKLINMLEIPKNGRVLDVGCGTGEFLLRLIESYRLDGLGIDIDKSALQTAEKAAAKRVGSKAIFEAIDIKKFEATPESFDCGICLGSTHAFATGEPAYPEALKGLAHLTKPGGLVLIGEGFWENTPENEYLDFIGEPVGVYRTHLENAELGSLHGLTPLYAGASTMEEWDDFEWSHHRKMEKQFELSPKQEKERQRLDFGRKWRMAYLKWGRGTMGFGFYLFRKPE